MEPLVPRRQPTFGRTAASGRNQPKAGCLSARIWDVMGYHGITWASMERRSLLQH